MSRRQGRKTSGRCGWSDNGEKGGRGREGGEGSGGNVKGLFSFSGKGAPVIRSASPGTATDGSELSVRDCGAAGCVAGGVTRKRG